jgi:hypothetical protein
MNRSSEPSFEEKVPSDIGRGSLQEIVKDIRLTKEECL